MDDEELQAKLGTDRYRVLRQGQTEPPFSGDLLNQHADGTYHCGLCDSLLFDSSTKFDSGSGWPSFNDVASKRSVLLVEDNSHGMHRVEVRCTACGSHLGHVFNDAPDQPTGMRFCINSLALKFAPKKASKQ